jgi:hypothetical protein
MCCGWHSLLLHVVSVSQKEGEPLPLTPVQAEIALFNELTGEGIQNPRSVMYQHHAESAVPADAQGLRVYMLPPETHRDRRPSRTACPGH